MFIDDDKNLPRYTSDIDIVSHNFVIKFTPEIVLIAINKLKSSFASGPDGINAYILKKVKYNILEPLTSIFEISYRTGKLPSIWLQALVTPIHKKGSQHMVDNYRPISLCCHMQIYGINTRR